MSSPTRKQILALIVAYYLLSQDEEDTLIAAIYDALRAAMLAAYQWNASHLGIATEWQPSKDEEEALSDLAKLRGSQIAATYEDDITRATNTFLDAYEQANGSLEGVLPELRTTLSNYTDARTEQKCTEISQFEASEGYESGVTSLIDDINTADEGDNVYVSDEDMAKLFIGVLPEYALTDDECAQWAGEMIELSEFDGCGMPLFPLHNRCPHYREFIDLRDEAA